LVGEFAEVLAAVHLALEDFIVAVVACAELSAVLLGLDAHSLGLGELVF